MGHVNHHRLRKYFTSPHPVPTRTLLVPRQIDDKAKCVLMHPNAQCFWNLTDNHCNQRGLNGKLAYVCEVGVFKGAIT